MVKATRRAPRSPRSVAWVLRTAVSTEARMRRAWSWKWLPAAVSSTWREVRLNSSTPNSSSRAAICRLRGGWEMCSRAAARPKCRVSARATK